MTPSDQATIVWTHSEGSSSMTTSATAVKRPVLVTVLVVFIVLSGISSVLTAILLFGMTSPALPAAVFALVVGLIHFAVAKGLLDGNPTARIVVAGVNVVQAVVAVATMIGVDSSSTLQSSAIRSLIFAVIILAILFSPAANAFFASRRR
jgi:hypothetical protein